MEIDPSEADLFMNRPESGRSAWLIRKKIGLSWADLRSAYSYEYPSVSETGAEFRAKKPIKLSAALHPHIWWPCALNLSVVRCLPPSPSPGN